MKDKKTAFIAIVGRPNVGKSSILNKMLGQKVSIVSSRPQTTRFRITGILTEGEVQLVFTDTPGFHKPRTKLGENMVKAIGDSISGVDAALFLTESTGEIKSSDLDLLNRLKNENIPVILAINKIDLVPKKEELLSKISDYSAFFDFYAVVPVSALKGDGIDELLGELMSLAKESDFFFPEDAITNQPEAVIISEIIREKLLNRLNDEVPHGIAVSIEKLSERENENIIDIEAVIFCEKSSHKGIIIGKNGETLKEISTKARKELEYMFDCSVFLKCWVKVKKDWRNHQGIIHSFGLD
ncbi:MAG: GTPase Era [Firmicutes bacterium ADurb.Bin300]|nr:MAG: GTPase Era [Firmicutes bacterium ADurb.Bin300]